MLTVLLVKRIMEKNDVDKKLIKWNDFFEELLVDARSFIKDLKEGISYIGGSGVVMIALGLVFLLYNLHQFWRGTLFTLLVLLGTGLDIFIGFVNITKFLQLRKKYSRLYDLQKKMEIQ